MQIGKPESDVLYHRYAHALCLILGSEVADFEEFSIKFFTKSLLFAAILDFIEDCNSKGAVWGPVQEG